MGKDIRSLVRPDFFSQLKSNEAHFLFQLCLWMLQWATTECFWTREIWCLKGYRCSNAAAQLIKTASLRTQHSEAKYLNFRAWRREGFIMESRKDNRWLVLKKPELLEGFQQSPLEKRWEEGMVSRGTLVTSFALAAVHMGQVTVPSQCPRKTPSTLTSSSVLNTEQIP